MFPKSPRVEDEKRLARIREMPCIFCGAPPPSEAAHFRAGLTGMGRKPDDALTFAMCRRHHQEQTLSKRGELGWWLDQLTVRPDLFISAIRAWARSQA
jgi:hypothetical protein